MIKKRFVVCDRDVRYLYRIQDFLVKKNLKDFQIEITDSLQEAVKQSRQQEYEIFIVSEHCLQENCETIKEVKADHIFILRETSKSLSVSFPCLEKYQSMEQILATILERYTSQVGKKGIQRINNRAKVISFYSATRTTKQTYYAFAASQLLTKANKKLLYLNLQPYSGLVSLLCLDGVYDLTDLIYYALQHTDRFGNKLDQMKYIKGGVELLPPSRDYEDLLTMTRQEWQEWLEVMIYEAGYEYLLIDFLGTGLFVNEILKNSDVIFYLQGTNKQERACDLEFENLVKRKESQEILNHIKKLEDREKEEITQYEDLYLTGYGIYMKQQLMEAGLIRNGD